MAKQSVPARAGHGGARKGAGRKRKARRRSVAHRVRAALSSKHPVHVTVTICRGLPSLRQKKSFRVVRDALFSGCNRFGFRLIEWSVQTNHLHLICEARGKVSLSRGMKGLGVRIAKRLNRLWNRKGQVIESRYHSRALVTPSEVRSALVYVLQNVKKHGQPGLSGIDLLSSGPWFDGWKRGAVSLPDLGLKPAVAALTWLLREGWRRLGLICPSEGPRSPS